MKYTNLGELMKEVNMNGGYIEDVDKFFQAYLSEIFPNERVRNMVLEKLKDKIVGTNKIEESKGVILDYNPTKVPSD